MTHSLCNCFLYKYWERNKKQAITHSLLHSTTLEVCLLRRDRLFSIKCQLFLHILSTILSVKWSPEYTESSRKSRFMSAQGPISGPGELHHIRSSDSTLFQFSLQSPVWRRVSKYNFSDPSVKKQKCLSEVPTRSVTIITPTNISSLLLWYD